jgi:TonB family protein
MASPAKIAQLPDTLPEDFGDWDNEDSPAAQPVGSGGFAPPPGFNAPKPPAQPAKPMTAPARRVTVISNTASNTRSSSAVANGLRNPATIKADAMAEADEVIFQTIRTNRATLGRQTRPRKNWLRVATVPGGLVVVILILVTLLYRGNLPLLRHTVEAQPVAADTLPANTIIEPPMQLGPAQKPSAANTDRTENTQPATEIKEAVQPQVESKMMQDQLSTPARIPHEAKLKASDDAPSSLNMGAANMEGQGNSNAIGSIFNHQSSSSVTVAPAKTVSVSAGVAGGLLIQRTPPIYPQIAKSARVTGTVVLKATISKTGIIENLHVVSGPSMLTQAAVDAVRTWRYRPYKLNNDPVEIETTVNVVFTLGS